jgi:hypothetical protein
MLLKNILLIILFSQKLFSFGQANLQKPAQGIIISNSENTTFQSGFIRQFVATCDFLDAAINSQNSFNSLIKKENYRVKITSFNNPTSSDMGFNLENEIQSAIKPLLAKAKSTNTNKFSQVISSLINTQAKGTPSKTSLIGSNPIFSTLLGLVGTLTIQEKKISREDLDSFTISISKYFTQYEKLNQANILFDQNIERINNKLKELQFDIKEYMLDMITILNKNIQRSQLKNLSAEELFLKYLDKAKLEPLFSDNNKEAMESSFHYPTDGIKTAKEISYNLQKLFNDYQKVYGDNFQQIRTILLDSKKLGKNINANQIDISLKELEELYNESKNSDITSLRLNTLFERLKVLSATEQNLINSK